VWAEGFSTCRGVTPAFDVQLRRVTEILSQGSRKVLGTVHYVDFAVLTGIPVHGPSKLCRDLLKYDGTRTETRFRLSAKRTSPFKSAGASIQSTTGSRGVRISGSNAEYTMFRGSVKGTGYPLHSPVSPSLPLPCVTVCHHITTGIYHTLPDFVHGFCPSFQWHLLVQLLCRAIVSGSFIHLSASCLTLDLSDSSCKPGHFVDMGLTEPEGRSRNSGDNINIAANARGKNLHYSSRYCHCVS